MNKLKAWFIVLSFVLGVLGVIYLIAGVKAILIVLALITVSITVCYIFEKLVWAISVIIGDD